MRRWTKSARSIHMRWPLWNYVLVGWMVARKSNDDEENIWLCFCCVFRQWFAAFLLFFLCILFGLQLVNIYWVLWWMRDGDGRLHVDDAQEELVPFVGNDLTFCENLKRWDFEQEAWGWCLGLDVDSSKSRREWHFCFQEEFWDIKAFDTCQNFWKLLKTS